MVDTQAEQLRLLDTWIDDMEMGIKELVEERVFEAEVKWLTWTTSVYGSL